MTRKLLALILSLFLLASALPASAEAFSPTPTDFIDTWEVLYFISDGVTTTPDSSAPASSLVRLIITEDSLTLCLSDGTSSACPYVIDGSTLTGSQDASLRMVAPDMLVLRQDALPTSILHRAPDAPNPLLGTWTFLAGSVNNAVHTADTYPSCQIEFFRDCAIITRGLTEDSCSVFYIPEGCMINWNGTVIQVQYDEQGMLILTFSNSADVLLFVPEAPAD